MKSELKNMLFRSKGPCLTPPIELPGPGVLVFRPDEVESEKPSERKITKEQFEASYCKRSNISLEDYHSPELLNRITLPCACGAKECEGWAAIPNDPKSIEDQMRIYGPKDL